MENVQVLIVGAGMAGITAAIWCKRLGLSAVLIERREQIGGQLPQIHNEIWDFPPNVYANGLSLLDHLLQHPVIPQLDCRLRETLQSIDTESKTVVTDRNQYQTQFVILATGVKPNTLAILEHSSLTLSSGFSTTIQGEELAGKRVLIIGGGDRAVESAFNLSSHAKHVWLAVRGKHFRARPEWVERLEAQPNVTILMDTSVVDTAEPPDEPGVFLRVSGQREPVFLGVEAVLPRIGIRGDSDFVPFLSRDSQGFLHVDNCQLTNVNWIYAIGDVTNGAAYASLSLASGQAMKAVKHISLRMKEG